MRISRACRRHRNLKSQESSLLSPPLIPSCTDSTRSTESISAVPAADSSVYGIVDQCATCGPRYVFVCMYGNIIVKSSPASVQEGCFRAGDNRNCQGGQALYIAAPTCTRRQVQLYLYHVAYT